METRKLSLNHGLKHNLLRPDKTTSMVRDAQYLGDGYFHHPHPVHNKVRYSVDHRFIEAITQITSQGARTAGVNLRAGMSGHAL